MTAASWVPYQYSCSVEECKDVNKITPQVGFEPVIYGFEVMPLILKSNTENYKSADTFTVS